MRFPAYKKLEPLPELLLGYCPAFRNAVGAGHIPSTQYKNNLRYQAMCFEIASKYPVVICSDRENSRGQKSANTIGNLTFSGSDYGSDYGKDVILFDDITTRGTSFI